MRRYPLTQTGVFQYLQIDNRLERQLVGAADLALAPCAAINAWRRPTSDDKAPPKRCCCFAWSGSATF